AGNEFDSTSQPPEWLKRPTKSTLMSCEPEFDEDLISFVYVVSILTCHASRFGIHCFWIDHWKLPQRMHRTIAIRGVGCVPKFPLSALQRGDQSVRQCSCAELFDPGGQMPIVPAPNLLAISGR